MAKAALSAAEAGRIVLSNGILLGDALIHLGWAGNRDSLSDDELPDLEDEFGYKVLNWFCTPRGFR